MLEELGCDLLTHVLGLSRRPWGVRVSRGMDANYRSCLKHSSYLRNSTASFYLEGSEAKCRVVAEAAGPFVQGASFTLDWDPAPVLALCKNLERVDLSLERDHAVPTHCLRGLRVHISVAFCCAQVARETLDGLLPLAAQIDGVSVPFGGPCYEDLEWFLERCTALKCLRIDPVCHLPGAKLGKLFPDLEELSLLRGIDDAWFNTGLSGLPKLQSLDVMGTLATLEGVRCIAASLPDLHSLSLVNNPHMEMDKVAGAVKGMKALRNVMVSPPSTKAKRRALCDAFQDLNISIWFGNKLF